MVLDKNKDILSIINRGLAYAQNDDPNAEYEIELGVELLSEIIIQQEKVFYRVLDLRSKDEKSTLFDETLRINYNDPYVFKLWKSII